MTRVRLAVLAGVFALGCVEVPSEPRMQRQTEAAAIAEVPVVVEPRKADADTGDSEGRWRVAELWVEGASDGGTRITAHVDVVAQVRPRTDLVAKVNCPGRAAAAEMSVRADGMLMRVGGAEPPPTGARFETFVSFPPSELSPFAGPCEVVLWTRAAETVALDPRFCRSGSLVASGSCPRSRRPVIDAKAARLRAIERGRAPPRVWAQLVLSRAFERNESVVARVTSTRSDGERPVTFEMLRGEFDMFEAGEPFTVTARISAGHGGLPLELEVGSAGGFLRHEPYVPIATACLDEHGTRHGPCPGSKAPPGEGPFRVRRFAATREGAWVSLEGTVQQVTPMNGVTSWIEASCVVDGSAFTHSEEVSFGPYGKGLNMSHPDGWQRTMRPGETYLVSGTVEVPTDATDCEAVLWADQTEIHRAAARLP